LTQKIKKKTYKTVEVDNIITTQIQPGQNYQLNYQMKTIKNFYHELYHEVIKTP
jgi:hypothetical protein